MIPSIHELVTEIVIIEDEPEIGDFVKRGLVLAASG